MPITTRDPGSKRPNLLIDIAGGGNIVSTTGMMLLKLMRDADLHQVTLFREEWDQMMEDIDVTDESRLLIDIAIDPPETMNGFQGNLWNKIVFRVQREVTQSWEEMMEGAAHNGQEEV